MIHEKDQLLSGFSKLETSLILFIQSKIPSEIFIYCEVICIYINIYCCCCSVTSNYLWPHGLQHARLPCPSLTPRVCLYQHKRRLYTWTSPDGQHRNQIDYILCSQRGRSSIQSAKTKPGADCGSDHELLIAKFRLKLKKVGKTTRPFRYDLNQIPYDYTVEVRNRFKGLDLIDRVPDELWMEVRNVVQETGIKTIPMEKKFKKAKWLSGRPYK